MGKPPPNQSTHLLVRGELQPQTGDTTHPRSELAADLTEPDLLNDQFSDFFPLISLTAIQF